MVDTDKLRGLIAEKGMSQRSVAHKIGVKEATFYRKMQKKVFNSDEIYMLIELLDIKNPLDIFFTNRGA